MEYRAKIFGVALLCVAFGSEALTLGRLRGAALVGRPLDIVVQVQMDPGEDTSAQCFEADVFHADARQDANRVQVVVEATAQAPVVNVRILSSAVVDEPVVNIDLRTRCGQKTTRRYVLLANLPSEVAVSATPQVTPVSVNLTARPVPDSKAKTVQEPTQTARSKDASKRSAEHAAPASPRSTTPGEGLRKAARSSGQSRLKLDMLDLMAERDPTLKSSDELLTPPTDNAQRRSDAAALWRALNASPEDTLREIARVQNLGAEVNALKTITAKNQLGLTDLGARLHKAESEGYPAKVIYGLVFLILASLSAVAFLLYSQRRLKPSGDGRWNDPITLAEPAVPEAQPAPPPGLAAARKDMDAALLAKAPPTAPPSRFPNDSGYSSGIDVNLTEMTDSRFADFMRPGAARHGNHKMPSLSLPAKAPKTRHADSLNSDTVLDIRQQAEFFASLSQTDHAVRILKKQIDDSAEPNPFVYLDLLGMLHSLNLKNDFQQFRADFNLLFYGSVSEFALFKDEGKSLESYSDILSRIVALWPMPEVLNVIEACIFRDTRDASSQTIDLAAFRDLLLLHTVAHLVVHATDPEDGKPGPVSLSIPAVQASAPADFSDSGPAMPLPSGGPGRATSVPPDFSTREIELPPVLDLDLSVSSVAASAPHPALIADVDLSQLMPGDHPADDQGANAS